MVDPKIFKAYDVRGRYPGELNEEAAKEIAAALAKHFKKGKFIIAHDTRLSSPSLYKAVIKSLEIRNLKLEIEAVGLATTPMFYFLVNKLKAVGGIMITASHNPKDFNGLKVVKSKAEMISGKEIYEIYKNLH